MQDSGATVPLLASHRPTETKYRKKLAAASKTLVDLQECTGSVLSEKLGAILKEVGPERIKKVVDEVKERLKVEKERVLASLVPQEVVALTKLLQLAYDATADKHFQQELASVEMGKKEANKKKLAWR